MLRFSSIAFTAAVLIVPTYTGWAQERVEAGALQCRGSTTSFVVGSVTDNLLKGAAGGSLQWANRLLGFPESAGLTAPAAGWL